MELAELTRDLEALRDEARFAIDAAADVAVRDAGTFTKIVEAVKGA